MQENFVTPTHHRPASGRWLCRAGHADGADCRRCHPCHQCHAGWRVRLSGAIWSKPNWRIRWMRNRRRQRHGWCVGGRPQSGRRASSGTKISMPTRRGAGQGVGAVVAAGRHRAGNPRCWSRLNQGQAYNQILSTRRICWGKAMNGPKHKTAGNPHLPALDSLVATSRQVVRLKPTGPSRVRDADARSQQAKLKPCWRWAALRC